MLSTVHCSCNALCSLYTVYISAQVSITVFFSFKVMHINIDTFPLCAHRLFPLRYRVANNADRTWLVPSRVM